MRKAPKDTYSRPLSPNRLRKICANAGRRIADTGRFKSIARAIQWAASGKMGKPAGVRIDLNLFLALQLSGAARATGPAENKRGHQPDLVTATLACPLTPSTHG